MKKKEYGVLGLGKFGMAVAKTLAENGNSVIAVDSDPERVDEIADFVTFAVECSTETISIGIGCIGDGCPRCIAEINIYIEIDCFAFVSTAVVYIVAECFQVVF